MPEPVQLDRVDVEFGHVPVLRELSLRIPSGQCVALLGPSGTGKTTLLRTIAGTVTPSRGTVRVFDQDLSRLSRRALLTLRRRIGLLYQNDALVPGLRTMHNVLIGRLGRWSLAKSIWSLFFPRELDLARAALAQVGMADRLLDPIATLSGGQRQRVAIARLLAQDAELILADEPTTHLDPRLSREIVELLLQLSKQAGRTCIISLHDLAMLNCGFDRVLAMRDGAWHFDGHPAAFDAEKANLLFRGAVSAG